MPRGERNGYALRLSCLVIPSAFDLRHLSFLRSLNSASPIQVSDQGVIQQRIGSYSAIIGFKLHAIVRKTAAKIIQSLLIFAAEFIRMHRQLLAGLAVLHDKFTFEGQLEFFRREQMKCDDFLA